MSAMKIKKGDTVKVIAGKDNGKEGKVLAVNAKDNTVVVENINKVTKHSKPSAADPHQPDCESSKVFAYYKSGGGTEPLRIYGNG